MPREPYRRFSLFDVMILIAAIAVAIVYTRFVFSSLTVLRSTLMPWPYRRMASTIVPLHTATLGVLPTLVIATFAALVLRLRRPRPRWRRIMLQPGAVGCTVAVISIVIMELYLLSLRGVGSKLAAGINLQLALIGNASYVSFAVFGSWVTLALTGRWKPEPSWIDRLGVVVSSAWILELILQVAFTYFL